MGTLHDVLRYLLERVPHSTQDEHDRVAALIDQDEHGPADKRTEEPIGPDEPIETKED